MKINNSGKSHTVLILLLVVSLSVLILLGLVAEVVLKDNGSKKNNRPSAPITNSTTNASNANANSTIASSSANETGAYTGESGTGTVASFENSSVNETEEDINNRGKEISLDNDFYTSTITDSIFLRIDGKSFNQQTPVKREDLRYIHVLYNDLNGTASEGELIVNQVIAVDILQIFYDLYKAGYKLECMNLVDEYGSSDNVSMSVNNTSAFNTRMVDGTDTLSLHAYGLAIDVNPLYNPYVSGNTVLPATARAYVDRSTQFDMKLTEDDLCVKTFISHGFVWGGNWNTLKDYMHFEYPASLE